MKTSTLSAAMSFIDDDLVSAAVDYKPKRNRLPAPYRITASIAAACMVLAIGVSAVHLQLKQYVKENDIKFEPSTVVVDSNSDGCYGSGPTPEQADMMHKVYQIYYDLFEEKLPWFGTCYYDYETDKTMVGLTEDSLQNREKIQSFFGDIEVTFFKCDYSQQYLQNLLDKLYRNRFFLKVSGVDGYYIYEPENRIVVAFKDAKCYLGVYLVNELCDSSKAVAYQYHVMNDGGRPDFAADDSCVDITYDQSRQLDRANAAWYALYRHQVPYFGTCYYDFETDKIMVGLTENTPEKQAYVLSLFGKFPVTFYQCDYSWLHLEELCDKLDRNRLFLKVSGVEAFGMDDVNNRVSVLLKDDNCSLAKYLVTRLCGSDDVVVFKTVDEIDYGNNCDR